MSLIHPYSPRRGEADVLVTRADDPLLVAKKAKAGVHTILDPAFSISAGFNLGAVYTPPALATWLAAQVMRNVRTCKRPIVVDPACGDGALLSSVRAVVSGNAELIGVDLDETALDTASARMQGSTRTVLADALVPQHGVPARQAWREMIPAGADAVIANPPWGADLVHDRASLAQAGYTLTSGQYDSYELFLELSIKIVRPGGVVGVIIPDSVFLPEHVGIRKLLLRETTLLLIARLGEGLFPGVYRGATVLLLRNEAPAPGHLVSCFRLPKAWRDRVLADSTDLQTAQDELAHEVPQRRFALDPAAQFDIDLTEAESSTVRVIAEAGGGWTASLIGGRGVELSKSGQVLRCTSCQTARPRPRSSGMVECAGCGEPLSSETSVLDVIVRKGPSPGPDWHPLIVGEDVDRYSVAPSRSIRIGVAGINYKDADGFAARKLLVRKTGVGLKAAIDASRAITSQVVFHYRLGPDRLEHPFLLDYFWGVLNSRVMLAYHLKRFGDNEWRSHPYVTQRVLAELPIPQVAPGTWQWSQAIEIARATREIETLGLAPDRDLRVEALVAGLYGLKRTDCEWVLGVLDGADALQPIRSLRVDLADLLDPVRSMPGG